MGKNKKSDHDKSSSAEFDRDKRLNDYLKIMEKEGLHELEISDGDVHVKLVRQSAVPTHTYVPSESPAAETSAPASSGNEKSVKSPIGGVFYRSPSPKSPAFVKEGDAVKVGQTLCIVEAMKVMNEIKSDLSGKIVKILVENGKPVDSDQPLFILE